MASSLLFNVNAPLSLTVNDEDDIKTKALASAESQMRAYDPAAFEARIEGSGGAQLKKEVILTIVNEVDIVRRRRVHEPIRTKDLKFGTYLFDYHGDMYRVEFDKPDNPLVAFIKWGKKEFKVENVERSHFFVATVHAISIVAEIGQLWAQVTDIAEEGIKATKVTLPHFFSDDTASVVRSIFKVIGPRMIAFTDLVVALERTALTFGRAKPEFRKQFEKFHEASQKSFKDAVKNFAAEAVKNKALRDFILDLALCVSEFGRLLNTDNLVLPILGCIVGRKDTIDWVKTAFSTAASISALYLTGGYAMIPQIVFALLRVHGIYAKLKFLYNWFDKHPSKNVPPVPERPPTLVATVEAIFQEIMKQYGFPTADPINLAASGSPDFEYYNIV